MTIKSKKPGKPCVLLVEDNLDRVEMIQDMFPDTIHVVWAGNAASAIGLVSRDVGGVYSGVMLDFDLDRNRIVSETMTGEDVARQIMQSFDPDTQVLVHSMNPVDRGRIVRMLETSGFSVLLIPMANLTKENLSAWLQAVQQVHDERVEDRAEEEEES